MTTQKEHKVTSLQPHILNAIIYWMYENDLVPHIVVKKSSLNVIPPHLVNQDTVTFNINAKSIDRFEIDDTGISFNARFNQKDFRVRVPVENITALVSRTDNKIFFTSPFLPAIMFKTSLVEEQVRPDIEKQDADLTETKPKKDRSHLSIVKN